MSNTDPATVAFDPLITLAQVHEMEEKHAANAWRVSRRVALATLTRSRDELVAGCSEMGEEALIEMIDFVADYQAHAKAFAQMAEAALARLLCVATAIEKGAA